MLSLHMSHSSTLAPGAVPSWQTLLCQAGIVWGQAPADRQGTVTPVLMGTPTEPHACLWLRCQPDSLPGIPVPRWAASRTAGGRWQSLLARLRRRCYLPASLVRWVLRQLPLNPDFVLAASSSRACAGTGVWLPCASTCSAMGTASRHAAGHLGSTDQAVSWICIPKGLLGS